MSFFQLRFTSWANLLNIYQWSMYISCIFLTYSSYQFKQHLITSCLRWYPFTQVSLAKINGSQNSKHQRIHVKIVQSQSCPSQSDFAQARTSRNLTTCVAVKANAQHVAATCATCHEKQESSFCVPIKALLLHITFLQIKHDCPRKVNGSQD